MATRRVPNEAPDLKPETIAVLLAGWGAVAPEPSEHGFGGGLLDLFDAHGAGFARLWNAHRDFLLAKARAWGWKPGYSINGTRMFYAEYVVRTGRDDDGPAAA